MTALAIILVVWLSLPLAAAAWLLFSALCSLIYR